MSKHSQESIEELQKKVHGKSLLCKECGQPTSCGSLAKSVTCWRCVGAKAAPPANYKPRVDSDAPVVTPVEVKKDTNAKEAPLAKFTAAPTRKKRAPKPKITVKPSGKPPRGWHLSKNYVHTDKTVWVYGQLQK